MAIKIAGTTVIDGSRQIQNLGAPLTPTQGGTGLATPGTAGNVLTSNGTSWVSSPSTGEVTLNGTQTLTNKNIAFADNTLTGVQPTLVSGTSIKTVNGTSLLGSGDITIIGGTGDVTLTGIQTITNKRITPRVSSISSASTITPTGDSADQYIVTAQAAAATIAAPSGTPTDGQRLILRIEDNGTPRALTWTTGSGAYRAVGVTLPTTTVASKSLYVGMIYNSQDVFWDVLAVAVLA